MPKTENNDNVIPLFTGSTKTQDDPESLLSVAIRQCEKLFTEGKIDQSMRNGFIGALYAVRHEAIRETKKDFIEWFKNETQAWLKHVRKYGE